ncbi:MAG: ABC transporter ATP-binding protein [Lysobacterales bacterium]
MDAVITLNGLTKTYASGLVALQPIDLIIERGEIFALLGPNGAGKTTLINMVCGIVTPTAGQALIDGHDVVRDYRAARARVGLVPQELATEMFETPWASTRYSRGLFGCPPAPDYLERLLRDLSLWNKAHDKVQTLSGGMKRRVMIAKALAHEPAVLFLDEPTAGVDVELRADMWALVRRLRDQGVTIILTTHYIDEAEEMADRIGVIDNGRLVLVEEKARLMKQLGKRQLIVQLTEPLSELPVALAEWKVEFGDDNSQLRYVFDAHREHSGIPELLRRLDELQINYRDLNSSQNSLEEIFVGLVGRRQGESK